MRAVAAVALGALALAVPAAHAAPPEGEWLAGDLHVHSTYSHDSYGGPGDDNTEPGEAYTFGWTVGEQFQNAATRGLDFLAITDHEDIRSQQDPGFGAGGVIPVPGYENSLKGHAQMLGATKIYDNGDESPAAVIALANALRADGGAFQVNHPAEGSTDFPNDADWSYLYAVEPDIVEVWNISRVYQPPFPSASSNDDAVRYWEGWLDRGAKVGATGGSDNHWRSTFAAQGAGQPTTFVFARERTVPAILEGIREGRTFISHQPPSAAGPRLFLESDDAIVGGEVKPKTPLRVRVQSGAGMLLRLIGTGSKQIGEPVPVVGPEFEHRFDAPEKQGWVRAELFDPDLAEQRETGCGEGAGSDTTYCRNMLGITAMTSAIYVRPPVPPIGRIKLGRAWLHGPRRCVRRVLLAHVHGGGVLRVKFYVDGRWRGVARRSRARLWPFRANVSRLKPGRHRLEAGVSFRGGLAGRMLRRSFRVCKRR